MEEKTPNPKETKPDTPLTMKPIVFKVPDLALATFRKNLLLFKDLTEPSIHYSAFYYGSTFDLHSTRECKDGKNLHRQIVKMNIDWDSFFAIFTSDISRYWKVLFKRAKTDDPDLASLQVEYVPFQALGEILAKFLKTQKMIINDEFVQKLEDSLIKSKLSEIPKEGVTLGQSSRGDLVITFGDECWIFNTSKYFILILKNLELSIREFHICYLNLGILAWLIKIRLRQLNQSVINHLSP